MLAVLIRDLEPWIVPVLVALIAPLCAYLAAVRKMSGRVATTEAERIWEEAGKLRATYIEEIHRLRESITEIEERLAVLEDENLHLRDKNFALEAEIRMLHAENSQLRLDNERLSERVRELEKANQPNGP